MIILQCKECQTSLSATEAQAGSMVRCPACATTLSVPIPLDAPQPTGAGSVFSPETAAVQTPTMTAPSPTFPPRSTSRSPGKKYGFQCGYCSSRLEATESMAAQEGQCPTCGCMITIPILDRYGRLIDPKSNQIIRPDPHPVHTYAAAGDRAPLILRRSDGTQNIQCPKCSSVSPVTANNCKVCGMPFTMEGTSLEAAGVHNGNCVASLVLGLLGMFFGCSVILPLLGIIFGVIGLNQLSKSGVQGGGRRLAIAGIICGSGGLLWGVPMVWRWLL